MANGQAIVLDDAVYHEGRYRIPLQKKLGLWYLLRKRESP